MNSMLRLVRALACWHRPLELAPARQLPDKTTSTSDACSAWKAHLFHPTAQLMYYIHWFRNRAFLYYFNSNIYHIPLKYVVHDFVTLQSRSVDQQLERKLQPRIHLPPTRFSLAFFSSSLRFHIVIHFGRIGGWYLSVDVTNYICLFQKSNWFREKNSFKKSVKNVTLCIANCYSLTPQAKTSDPVLLTVWWYCFCEV